MIGLGADRRLMRVRTAYLATHPLCECGCGRRAWRVAHKNDDAGLIYAWDNLRALARPCWDRETAELEHKETAMTTKREIRDDDGNLIAVLEYDDATEVAEHIDAETGEVVIELTGRGKLTMRAYQAAKRAGLKVAVELR